MTTTTRPYVQLRVDSSLFENPRTFTGLANDELRELALHIGRHGLINRLVIRSDGYIVAGQRRHAAIGLLLRWRETLIADVELSEYALFDMRAAQLAEVPVEVNDSEDVEGIALADNLQRADLSSFEAARAIARMATTRTNHKGRSQAQIARAIGKSPSWVSRHLTAWRGAGEQTMEMWRTGELTFDQVLHLASLSVEEQNKKLAGGAVLGVRGPANRPGIDSVKEARDAIELRMTSLDRESAWAATPSGVTAFNAGYRAAALDALRWATGETSSPAFAKLIQGGTDGT